MRPEMRTRLTLTMIFGLCASLFASSGRAQEPGSYAAIGTKLTFAKHLGYKQPGVGFNASLGAGLREFTRIGAFQKVYVTEDFEAVHEEKTALHDGHTIASITGANYYIKDGWFARSALSVTNHSNSAYSKTATRFHVGGGYSLYKRGAPAYGLPVLNATAVAFVPIGDPNSGRGVNVSAETFWPSWSWLGLRAKGTGSFGSYKMPLGRFRASYGAFEFGVFVNLSAIAGS